MTLNDLEPSESGFSEFFAIFKCSANFNTELRRNGLDIDQDLHIKFSSLNVDFSSLNPYTLDSRRPAQAGVKDGYPR